MQKEFLEIPLNHIESGLVLTIYPEGNSEIREIDETLNDKEKLKKEYINRNSKLPNKDKIFSVSFLYDILENERKAQVEKLKTMNGYLDPRNFSKQKTNMENECSLLKNVIELSENGDLRKQPP